MEPADDMTIIGHHSPPGTTAAPHPSYTPPPLPAYYRNYRSSDRAEEAENNDYHNHYYTDEPLIARRGQPPITYSDSTLVELPSVAVSGVSPVYSDLSGTRSTPSLPPPSYMSNIAEQPAQRPRTGDPFSPPRRTRNGRGVDFVTSPNVMQRGVNSAGYPSF